MPMATSSVVEFNIGDLSKKDRDLKQFRNYCGLIRIARCGFPWEKTTKMPTASRISCIAALAENNYVRLSSQKVACSSVIHQHLQEIRGPSTPIAKLPSEKDRGHQWQKTTRHHLHLACD
jgi:hypothetical protein